MLTVVSSRAFVGGMAAAIILLGTASLSSASRAAELGATFKVTVPDGVDIDSLDLRPFIRTLRNTDPNDLFDGNSSTATIDGPDGFSLTIERLGNANGLEPDQ